VSGLFDISRFTPHGFCLAWDPELIWILGLSDLLVAAAYFSIPAALVVFARRRKDLAFKPIFGLFAAFILACGSTHVMGAITLWVPLYRLAAWINVITAGLSVATAVMLWPLIPKALALPSPAALRDVNAALAAEVERRDGVAQQLRESETRLQRLYARTPAALHATDRDGTLIEVSDRWLDLTGYTHDEVVGRDIRQFYAPASQEVSRAQQEAMQRGEDIAFGERQFLCRDGTVRDVEAVFEPERDENGRLVRIMAAVTDVTARKEAEAALLAAEERLRHSQKMEAVGQLTGGIAHDFNNLLTTIMGSLELLQTRSPLDERGKRLAANALEGSRRAARLTSQLLSFSRRQRLAPEALDPRLVIDGIHDLLARTLGDGVTLQTVVPEAAWPLMADRNQLETALLNLVINARDAVRDQGQVRIDIANETIGPRDANPDGLPPGDYVTIAVEDNGMGMTEEVRRRAFEPFFTTKGPGAGTGLGLSQTYGFVTQSGGTVRLETAPGRGTRIALVFPRAQSQAPGLPRPNSEQTARPGHGENILLVEDDELLRQTMADALRGRGYTVTEAEDGAKALRLLEAADAKPGYALMFTDVMMPGGVNGVDLALRARQKRPSLPVLFATGYSSASLLAAWPEAADLLQKPYTPEEAACRIAARLEPAGAGQND
jgi:PAS domain S-box-containing protein